jgi:hypothetical protein
MSMLRTCVWTRTDGSMENGKRKTSGVQSVAVSAFLAWPNFACSPNASP